MNRRNPEEQSSPMFQYASLFDDDCAAGLEARDISQVFGKWCTLSSVHLLLTAGYQSCSMVMCDR